MGGGNDPLSLESYKFRVSPRRYIQADVRKPLSEYVGASAEFNLGKWFAGEKEETFEPRDPLNLCLLSKVYPLQRLE